MEVSMDDILGPNVDNIASENITKTSTKFNTSNNSNINANCFGKNRSTNDIGIDSILNNGLINFENKLQTSMFFITYKSLDAIYKELHTKYNFTIPTELVEKAVNTIIPEMIKDYTGNMKKRSKKIISDDMVCMGRKLDNKQCSRKKHNGTDFCKSHLRKLSNGRIDQPHVPINRNKRGRKRKVQFDPRQYDNEYITLWEEIIDGHKVLVDNNNNVYTFNLNNPVFLGKKDIKLKLDLDKISKSAPDTKVGIQPITPLPESQSIAVPVALPESQPIAVPVALPESQPIAVPVALPESQPVAKPILPLENSRVVSENHSRDEIITKLDIDIEDKINDLVITEDNASPIEIDKEINKIENPITKPKPTRIIKKKNNKTYAN
jgi:hypothetical protein